MAVVTAIASLRGPTPKITMIKTFSVFPWSKIEFYTSGIAVPLLDLPKYSTVLAIRDNGWTIEVDVELPDDGPSVIQLA